MGADSAGVGGWYSRSNRVDPKIYRIGDGKMLIGFTSSFRMGQLLGHALVLPEHHADVSIETWLVTDFVDAVRNCLKAGGFAKKDSEVESAGIFLVAYRGRIFHVQGDYQVGERAEPYDAVGCGFDLALGSLHATEQTVVPLTDRARARARMALEAAAAFSAGVHPPFIFEELAP
jgi:ATP-dependent protease HslVU (ClpYQ) peptidase subunit